MIRTYHFLTNNNYIVAEMDLSFIGLGRCAFRVILRTIRNTRWSVRPSVRVTQLRSASVNFSLLLSFFCSRESTAFHETASAPARPPARAR